MKDKREKVLRDIGMLTLIVVLILGKLGKVKIQIILGAVSFIICTLGGIYCIYKGLKSVGAFFFCISLGLILVFFSYYYDSDILAVPIPSILGMVCVFGYKGYKFIYGIGNKETKRLKKNCVIGVALCSIIQILMIALLFIKH